MSTTTTNLSAAATEPDAPAARLQLSATAGRGQLDGGWWPRSKDIAVELRQLLAAVPASTGRVTRVSLPTGDWPLPHPTRSTHHGLPVKVGWFNTMEPHTVTLGSSSAATPRLLLLVVPDGTTDDQAERDLATASTPTALRTTALLAELAVPAPRDAATATAAPVDRVHRPSADRHRPDVPRPDTDRPDPDRADTHGPDTHGPDTHGPDTHGPDTHRPVLTDDGRTA